MTYTLYNVASQAVLGAGFGYVLVKGQVFEPSVIQAQMQLRDFTMVSFMLSAVSMSQVVHSILWLTSTYRPLLRQARQGRARGHVAAILGGTCLGIGMSYAGSCPGTMPAQVGSGVPGGAFVLAGTIAGALLFGIVQDRCGALIRCKPSKSADAVEKAYPSYALLSAVVMGGASILAFVYLPHRPLSAGVWYPFVSGASLGCLQLLSWILEKEPLGASTSCVALASYVAMFLPHSVLPIGSQPRTILRTAFPKVAWILGAALGARYSISTTSLVPEGVSDPITGFLGGFFVLFGARLAGGCTSGHGVSGLSLLQPSSALVAASIFGGGILTSMVLGRLF